jgi:hypothetical protein
MTTTAEKTSTRAKDTPAFPFAAMVPGNKEWEDASGQMLQSWKQQLDTGLKLIDAAVQGTLEMRSSQLAAAMETHARDLDAENLVTGAKSLSDLMAIQLEWMTSNLERSIAYWNQMLQASVDAYGKLVECVRAQVQSAEPERPK